MIMCVTSAPIMAMNKEKKQIQNKTKPKISPEDRESLLEKIFHEKYVQVDVDPMTLTPIYKERKEYIPQHPFGWRASDKDREEYAKGLYRAKY